jgi:short-subunit dehydrogenase
MKETVLITGSSKGLGRWLANSFADNNYNIILHGRDIKALHEVKKEIMGKGVEVTVIIGDLKKNLTIDRLYYEAKKKDISVFINNAGTICPGVPLEQITEKNIEEILITNLCAPINLTQKVYTFFIKKGFGTIININSIIGLEFKKLRTLSCAAKWGLNAFSNSLKLEAKEKNIRVLDIYPSRIKTRQEYSQYGWDPMEISNKIYKAYEDTTLDSLILDNRPAEYKQK